MNYYRIMIWHTSQRDSMTLGTLPITKEATFIHTNKTLDINSLFEQGVAVKKYETLPETGINGQPLNVIETELE